MIAPANPKSSSSSPSTPSAGSRLYLRPRTKVWALALCFVLMIGASVWAVLQPVRPDPVDSSWRNSVLYPHETNPYARLQAVSCANEYACRLNSVAVNGTGELPEVWAVGNVGLVLHRAAGQTKWEQLTINAVEAKWEQLAINAVEANAPPKPSPLPTPRSTPEKNSAGARPAPTPTPTPIAAPTPTPDQRVPVPNLLGLSEAEARKIAESQGFTVAVEYESGGNAANQSAQSKAPSLSTQQSAPPRQVVVKQSPEPKALAPQKSTITITMGRAPRSAASLLDKLLPTVYAAELEKQPKSQGTSVPHLSREQTRRALTAAPNAKPVPVVLSPFDDDLIHVACESGECRIFGRSGRIYKAVTSTNWSFITAKFSGVPAEADSFFMSEFTLDGQAVYGKADSALYKCDFHASDKAPFYSCNVSSDKSLDLQIPGGSLLRLYLDQVNLNGGSLAMIRIVTHGPDAKNLVTAFSNVRSVAFNSNLAVVVGEHGTILASTDNGGTWLHETQGPDGVAPNHKLPALWYWLLAGLLMGISSVVVAIPVVPPAAEVSVADWAVTDAPLKPGDIDSLNFTPMALGLSRFIRNPKTQPPVTIAIEGEWGEGKSSVMSLLEGDLKKSRYCPVWFNAWHYQSEEQLLAALLEHVKDQAIPPWWHIDNWIFRARLLGNRMKLKWPLVAVLAIVFVSSAAYEIASHGIDEFIQSPTNLIPYKDQILSLFKAKDKADQSSKDKPGEAASASAGAKASGTQPSAQEPSDQKPCNPGDKCDPGDLRHLGLIASFFGLLGAILKIAKAFGIDSSKLTDNLRDVTTIKDVKPDPGIRRQFAREFGDLCEAWSWGGRRVIIFIDDLDRCRPESVVTVLESINFLTTAGDCMIVLGMAQKQVTHAVGLGFKDIAQSQQAYLDGCNTEQEKAVARFKYGELYIKKLVNIVAHLPKTTPEQRRQVLESRAAEARLQNEQVKASAMGWRTGLWEWLSESGRLAVKFAPLIAMLLAIAISMRVGYQKGAAPAPHQEQGSSASTSSTSSSSLSNDGKHSSEPAPSKSGEAKPLVYHPPTTEQAKLVEPASFTGGSWWSYSSSALVLVIFFGLFGYQLSARTNQDAQNSPEFEKSLELWGEYIVGLCDTPREIKRALNDLRYQAMTRRMNGPSITRGERLARTLRQFVTGRKEKEPDEARVDEAALPPLKAAALASLSDDEEKHFLEKAAGATYPGITETMKMLLGMKAKHIELFGRWIGASAAEPPEPPDSSGDKAHASAA